MFAPKTKFPSFGAALPFPNTNITNNCFSAILKGLKLSSSSSAVNTSQFDNCQSFCCHVCSENKVSEFWRRSTLSKYKYYKLLLFCNFKRFEAEQFFFSGQYLTVWTIVSRSVVMFAPKTKFPSFGAALPFPNTNITNYCFSAILKGLKLSSSSSAVNTSQFDNCQSFCCHVCSENKVSEFWRRSTLSKFNYYKLLLFCILKKVFESSSSPTAINTSQFDNCQSFCCHVRPENKISDF